MKCPKCRVGKGKRGDWAYIREFGACRDCVYGRSK